MSRDAERLVSALAAARKSTQFYPPEHPNFGEAVGELVAAVAAATTGGPFVLNVHQGRLYAGSAVLTDDSPALTSVEESMEGRRIESLTFQSGFAEGDARGLAEVLNLRPSPTLDPEAELATRGVANVQVARIISANEEQREERDRTRERDHSMYRRVVSTMRSMSSRLQQGKDVDLAEAGGLVPDIMARMLEDPAAVVGLATLRSEGDAALFHSVNVMIYALTIAAALDLPEEGFASLGVAALLHDIGKAVFEADDPAQSEAMRLLHPKAGAEILSRLQIEDQAPMLVAYEHHMGIDGSGYPGHAEDYFPHPYSRMVAIADRYDRLTKTDAAQTLTPDRAIAHLLEEADGGPLDPMFTRLFVRSLGVFPIGCLVRLSDHSIGVVRDRGDDPLTPRLRLIYDPSGLPFDDPPEVDLASDDRAITEVVDEHTLAIATSDHL
jgi:putative nucleotidyltransferase with HDIG domain